MLIGKYIDRTGDIYDKACNALVFFKNNKDRDVRVTDAYIKLHSLENVETPKLVTAGELFGYTLKIYLINDGWGEANVSRVSVNMLDGDTELDISEFATDVNTELIKENIGTLEGGDILEVMSFPLSKEKLKDYTENFRKSAISLRATVEREGTQTECFIGFLGFFEDELYLEKESGFGGPQDIVRYILVDADRPFDELPLFPAGDTPVLAGTEKLGAVIIPTKSVRMSFSLHFVIDGDELLSTDIFDEEIHVPLYKTEGPYTVPLRALEARGLSRYAFGSDKELQRLIEYDPESIVN